MAHSIPLTGIDSTASIGTSPAVSAPGLVDFQKIIFQDDLANVFMSASEFAIPIQIFHARLGASGEWRSYNAIFDNPHALKRIGEQIDYSSVVPQFMISEAALAMRITKNDRFKVRGVEYRCEDAVSDGVGVTTVYMRTK